VVTNRDEVQVSLSKRFRKRADNTDRGHVLDERGGTCRPFSNMGMINGVGGKNWDEGMLTTNRL
jgi:hypothetical protein